MGEENPHSHETCPSAGCYLLQAHHQALGCFSKKPWTSQFALSLTNPHLNSPQALQAFSPNTSPFAATMSVEVTPLLWPRTLPWPLTSPLHLFLSHSIPFFCTLHFVFKKLHQVFHSLKTLKELLAALRMRTKILNTAHEVLRIRPL